MQQTRRYDAAERTRPAADQSIRGAQKTAMRPRNIHFSRRERRSGGWRSPHPLSEGMTAGEIAQTFGACLMAVLVGKGLLDLFAWLVGHFAKGWW